MTDSQTTETRPSIGPVPTEAEMGIFAETFQRIATAITAASKLSDDFEALRQQVEQLTKDLESQRQRNRWLDEEISDVRQARDTYKRQAGEYQSTIAKITGENALFVQDIDRLKSSLNSRLDELELAKKDRDEAMLKVMELEESLKEHVGKLNDIQSLAMDAFGLVPKPIPVPIVEPPAAPQDPWPVEAKPEETEAPEVTLPWAKASQ